MITLKIYISKSTKHYSIASKNVYMSKGKRHCSANRPVKAPTF